MEVFFNRREQLRALLSTNDMTAAELSRRSGVAQSSITRMLMDPARSKNAKNIGEKVARRLEAAAGKPPGWLDGSMSNEMRAQKRRAPLQYQPLVQDAPLLALRDLVSLLDNLPPVFWLELQDDAMAPRAPRGRRICFDTRLQPRPGDGVLIIDSAREAHFRLYRAGVGTRWSAHALNPAFSDMDSERDELRVLAVLLAEEGRWA